MVLKRTFKLFTAVVLKRNGWRLGSGSTVAAVWHWLTGEEAEAGLVAADVLTVRPWWLEERRLVLACQLVKTAVVCQSVGSSSSSSANVRPQESKLILYPILTFYQFLRACPDFDWVSMP